MPHNVTVQTGIQNATLAMVYASLFSLALNHKQRRSFLLLLVASAYFSSYNLLYDLAVQYRALTILALFVRILPPLEACWLIVGKRTEFRAALLLMLAVIARASLSPEFLAWGLLPLHHLVTVAVTTTCVFCWAFHWLHSFGTPRLFFGNLTLQTAWMLLNTASSLGYSWYSQTGPRYLAAAWIVVAVSILLLLGYRLLLSPSSCGARASGSESASGRLPASGSADPSVRLPS
jgi:hypothetical protein